MNSIMDLKDIQWAEFMFIDIFDIKNGFYNKKPNPSINGKIPFIGATQNNNGITEFYTLSDIENNSKVGYGKNEDIGKKMFNGNCIAVTNNGSVGFAYYQKTDFTCSHDVNPLYLKDYELNEYIAKFLISTIEKQRVCFEYARKWRPKRMVKSKILLPINEKSEPNYSFMELYIRSKEANTFEKVKKVINERIEKVTVYKDIVALNIKEWDVFFFNEIFPEIQRGKRLKKEDHIKGQMPYVSSSALNNGIDGFISNKNSVRIFNNCLSLANSGSVGATFYQPFKYVASDHVTKLENNKFNEFIYLFISTIAKRLSEKYSFNREINDQRIKREKIVLPIDEDGQPDYDYMENYIKKIEYEKLTKYIEIKTPNG